MKNFFIALFGMFAILSLYGLIVIDTDLMSVDSTIQVNMWLGASLIWWLSATSILMLVEMDTAV